MEKTNIGPILLKEVEQLAREKYLERESVFCCLERALQKISASNYGEGNDIRVKIDRPSGEIQVTRHRTVVDEVENPVTEVEVRISTAAF